jgi:AcrR family transcriptional regulator
MTEVNRTKDPSAGGAGHPPPPRIRRPKREAVRRRLLDAALTVFASRGFDSATLDQVAEAAGLTKGAIYSNFASKDELFFAMMNEQALRRAEAVRTALAIRPQSQDGPQGPDDQQAVRGIGRLLTRAFTQEREWQLVFLDFWGRAIRDDTVHTQFLAHRRALREAIAERIQQARGPTSAIGEFSVDELVTVVLALSNGLAIEEYIDPGVADDLLGRVLGRLAR